MRKIKFKSLKIGDYFYFSGVGKKNKYLYFGVVKEKGRYKGYFIIEVYTLVGKRNRNFRKKVLDYVAFDDRMDLDEWLDEDRDLNRLNKKEREEMNEKLLFAELGK